MFFLKAQAAAKSKTINRTPRVARMIRISSFVEISPPPASEAEIASEVSAVAGTVARKEVNITKNARINKIFLPFI